MAITIETFTVSIMSGFLFYLIGLPLPWVLGPLVAVLLWKNVFNRTVNMPLVCRDGGLIIIGYMMGSSFTKETAVQIARFLPSMTVVTLCVVCFSILLAFILYKPMGISFISALLGTVPGGLSQMAILSEEIIGADMTSVTLMQSIRVLSVVFFIPFFVIHGLAGEPAAPVKIIASAAAVNLSLYSCFKLLLFLAAATAGAWVAKKVHFPLPPMLGPLLVIALLQVSGAGIIKIPGFLLIPAQITLGIYMGKSYDKKNIISPLKTIVLTLLSSLALILFTFLIAYYLFVFYDMNTTTAFLSTAPGGMSEMAVTAVAVNADLSFVTAFQMFRLLFILFIVTPIYKFVFSKEGPESSTSPK